MPPDAFNLNEGRARRDEGMARLRHHSTEFRDQFARHIDGLPHGWTGTCEDIRRHWHGVQPHPNAWGACWNAAKKRGQLVELPTKVPMTAIKAHGRKTNLHRKP